jgi:CRP-like cAMP-binding protein
MAQSQQSVACNARHDIPQRLATWLMRARDSLEQNELALTQEFLAQMLGVQRASVSLIAGKLQAEGLIRYRRGRIEIIDEHKLGDRACECCGAVRTAYQRLLGDSAGKA